ncbi:MAG: DNA translocase FtsK [Gemmatimonadales bacterium]|nr:DNA translocase FtsK [Gemmatimonadales bacterium]
MSGRKPKKAKSRKKPAWYEASWLSGLLLLTVGVYLGLSLAGTGEPWWLGWLTGRPTADPFAGDNPGGPFGIFMSGILQLVFGAVWCWLFPVFLCAAGFGFFTGRFGWLRPVLIRSVPVWLISAAWIAQPGGPLETENAARLGGGAGFLLARGFHAMFGLWGGRIFLSLFLLVLLILVFKPWLGWLGRLLVGSFRYLLGGLGGLYQLIGAPFVLLARGTVGLSRRIRAAFAALGRRNSNSNSEPKMARRREGSSGNESGLGDSPTDRRVHNLPRSSSQYGDPSLEISSEQEGYDSDSFTPDHGPAPEERVLPGASGEALTKNGPPSGTSPGSRSKPRVRKRKMKAGKLPSLDLLTPASPEAQSVTAVELDSSADLLEETLRSFGVEGEVKDVRPGPVVTTFEFQPGHGIRVNQIVQRSDDLALAMRARSIRMEAPIPGKAAVGIEIPNPKAQMVRLREVLELGGQSRREPLSVILGKDVVGRPVSIDLASLPHLLVAGSTGSGKSVCLNSMICNLLLNNQPTTLRMILIDPKMLEMSVYNGIPHLLLPVVTDPREALKALQWMVAQMEYRYRKLAKYSVRNIKQYNDKVGLGEVIDSAGEKVTEPMPYYLTVVDELADLMLQLGKDLEDLITRLAQKARAVGIHLVLATQRPSVDVLTGVIKANIPCRIAFRVIQKNDSRTILDMNGAEQLLGNGDMLYLQPGRALPVRVHGSFIDVDECESLAAHWRPFSEETEDISLDDNPAGGGMHTGEDDLYEDAKRIVVNHQSGSTSLLQRRLRIGYTRAGRLMDMLEESGVVGPFTGSKARTVLIKVEELSDPDQEFD